MKVVTSTAKTRKRPLSRTIFLPKLIQIIGAGKDTAGDCPAQSTSRVWFSLWTRRRRFSRNVPRLAVGRAQRMGITIRDGQVRLRTERTQQTNMVLKMR